MIYLELQIGLMKCKRFKYFKNYKLGVAMQIKSSNKKGGFGYLGDLGGYRYVFC